MASSILQRTSLSTRCCSSSRSSKKGRSWKRLCWTKKSSSSKTKRNSSSSYLRSSPTRSSSLPLPSLPIPTTTLPRPLSSEGPNSLSTAAWSRRRKTPTKGTSKKSRSNRKSNCRSTLAAPTILWKRLKGPTWSCRSKALSNWTLNGRSPP